MFNLYFAGSRKDDTDSHLIKRKACRLLSYANDLKGIQKFCEAKERGPLLVDSGAFSVAHSGKFVDIDKYIDYINNNNQVENFIELDVIPYPVLNLDTAKESAEKSWVNYKYMIERLKEPFKLLPVFHFGEELNYLKRILEFTYKGEHIPYICIGGRHGVSIVEQEKYFKIVFNTVHKSSNPNVKIHVLGMTVFDTLEKFPFYSADSTTYLQHAIYGGINMPFGIVNISSGNSKKGNFKYLTLQEKNIVLKIISELGYNVDELANDYNARVRYNIDYVLNWAKNYKYKGLKTFGNINKLF